MLRDTWSMLLAVVGIFFIGLGVYTLTGVPLSEDLLGEMPIEYVWRLCLVISGSILIIGANETWVEQEVPVLGEPGFAWPIIATLTAFISLFGGLIEGLAFFVIIFQVLAILFGLLFALRLAVEFVSDWLDRRSRREPKQKRKNRDEMSLADLIVARVPGSDGESESLSLTPEERELIEEFRRQQAGR